MSLVIGFCGAEVSRGVPPGNRASIQATAYVEPVSGIQVGGDDAWRVHTGSYSHIVLSVWDDQNRERWSGMVPVLRSWQRWERCQPVLYKPSSDMLSTMKEHCEYTIRMVDPAT